MLAPPDHLGHAIQREAVSIIHRFAGLNVQDFEDGNQSQIGPPFQAPPIFTRIHHADLLYPV